MGKGGSRGWTEPGYRDLIAWQKAMDMADHAYSMTKLWPGDERFGLTSQVRRAAASVPANIAEGKGRGTSIEFARYLDIAYGSLCELETHIFLAQRQGYLDQHALDHFIARTTEVARLIHGLLKRLRPISNRALREDDLPYNLPDPETP